MNQIVRLQNETEFLNRLAAQRYLYNREKKWLAVLGLAAFAVAVLGTGVLTAFNVFSPYITAAAVVLFLAEFYFLKVIHRYRVDAARIQELFDSELFALPWNDYMEADKPDAELIIEASGKFSQRGGSFDALRDWYSVNVAELPLHQARILCQRSNVRWDGRQRRRYARWVFVLAGLMLAGLVVAAIYLNWGFQDFFTGPFPLALPLLTLLFTHAGHHHRAAHRLDALYAQLGMLKEEAFQPGADQDQLSVKTRQVQDAIFRHRRDSVPVFSWFYNLFRDDYESLTDEVVAQEAQSKSL